MSTIKTLLKEMEQEAQVTRKMLAVVPNDKFDWQPHPKSMTIRQLTTHIAEIPSWVGMGLTTDGIDFATFDYKPEVINNTEELLALHEKSLAESKEKLEQAKEEQLDGAWVMRHGDKIHQTFTKGELIRHAYNQITHHRAQLGVFLRLLDVPIPASYGPSADDKDSWE